MKTVRLHSCAIKNENDVMSYWLKVTVWGQLQLYLALMNKALLIELSNAGMGVRLKNLNLMMPTIKFKPG
ncbi:hypothetical protein NDQ71_20130 [Pseudoalteromonas sp. KG3]|nr:MULTISPECIES: hypothetical protein [Pseudoalteromonas]WKD26097.1 hypothetical protein NDQ71_20130 [Pseudoalteromonas sp. KG3]